MKLIIKDSFCDLNTYINAERGHWSQAAKIKKEETERVYWACKEQKLKPYKGIPNEAIFSWYHKNTRMDFDNVEFAQKFIWDGLVMAKILKSDGQKHTPKTRSHWHFIDKKNQRVEIELI